MPNFSAKGADMDNIRTASILMAVPYVLFLCSLIMDKQCLTEWYKRREKQKQAHRQKQVDEIKELAKHERLIPMEVGIPNGSCQNVDPPFFFTWLSMISLSASFIMFSREFIVPGIPSVRGSVLLMIGIALAIHSVLLFIVLTAKIMGCRLSAVMPSLKRQPRQYIDEDGKRFVLFSVKLKGFKKFLYLTVGAFLELVETLLDKASTVFDIKIFWVPSAFFRLSQEKLIIKNMRVDYRTVRYDLDYGEAYLRFCYEKLLNLLTFTIWSKFNEKYYRKWLDSRIHFVGPPPDGKDDVFEYNQAKPKWQAYVQACPLIASGVCCVCGQYILFKSKVEAMRMGGIRMVLKSSFGPQQWTSLYLRTCCSLFREKFNHALDDSVTFAGYVNVNKVQQFTECAFQTRSSQDKQTDGDVELGKITKNPINVEASKGLDTPGDIINTIVSTTTSEQTVESDRQPEAEEPSSKVVSAFQVDTGRAK